MIEYEGYKVVGDGAYGFKEIKAIGKGSVHLSLRGKYTGTNQAKRAIDFFLASQPIKKVVKKGETKDGGED